jgi:hypothetical protein
MAQHGQESVGACGPSSRKCSGEKHFKGRQTVLRRAVQVLAVLGICWLCFAGTAFADRNNGNNGNNGNSRNNGNNGNHRTHAPEIDVGSAAGALTIAAGALTLLRERLRRP